MPKNPSKPILGQQRSMQSCHNYKNESNKDNLMKMNAIIYFEVFTMPQQFYVAQWIECSIEG